MSLPADYLPFVQTPQAPRTGVLSRMTSWFSRGRTGLGRHHPVLGNVIRSNWAGIESGPWHRMVKADWLGPFTPSRVPFWTLKLMREDPQLALGMGALKAPFFSIEYRLRGGDPSARAFVEAAFHQTPLFTRALYAILNSLDFGFQTTELIWALMDVATNVEGIHKGTVEGAYVVSDLNDIDPERLTNLRVDDFGRMIGCTFDLTQTLHLEKLMHAVHQGEFRNHWGRSQLRRSYNPFYWCNWLYLYLMRYLEQKGNPPLIGTAPDVNVMDLDVDSNLQEGKDAVRIIAAQMASLRSGGAAALPWQPDANGTNQWSISELKVSERSEQFITSINHMQGMKLRALGIPERTMTQDTQTGSFASISEHVDLYYMCLEVIKVATVIPALNHIAYVLTKNNYKSTTQAPYFDAAPFSRLQQELVAKMLQSALGVPLTLEDGRTYTPAQLIDYEKSLEELNIPLKKASEVARKALPLVGGPPPPSTPLPPSAPKPPNAGAPSSQGKSVDATSAMSRVDEGYTDLAGGNGSRFLDAVHEANASAHTSVKGMLESVKVIAVSVSALTKAVEALDRDRPAPIVNVKVEPKAGDIKVINRNETPRAPDVNVSVAAPVVPVDITVQAPKRGGADVKFVMDGLGLPSGATIRPD